MADGSRLRDPMDKTAVLKTILEALRTQFEEFNALSRQTRAGGADPESRAEDKHDTRSTAASYLADGQARQAQQTLEAMQAIEALGPRPFAPGEPIAAAALVRLEFAGAESAWFFLAPAAGGLEVVVNGVEVTVLTPGSPLGGQLFGRPVGARLQAPPAFIREVL